MHNNQKVESWELKNKAPASCNNKQHLFLSYRKSPRKKAQASSRKKIAELCDRLSDSEDMLSSSPSSSEASQSEWQLKTELKKSI